MKKLKVITYTDKIAVVDMNNKELNCYSFNKDKVTFNASSEPSPKLIAHYPKIEGVAGIVIEKQSLTKEGKELYYELYPNGTDLGCDLFLKGYIVGKSNTFTEDEAIKIATKSWYQGAKESFEGLTTPFDTDIINIIKSLRKEYEVVMEEKEVECPECLGHGWTPEHGCCGNALPNGSCCGNSIMVQEPCGCGNGMIEINQPKLTENGEFIIREI